MASAVVDAGGAYPPPIVLELSGIEIPVIRCLLGALGIFAARPLARKKEEALPLWQFLLVTAVMLLMVEIWIVESRPGWLLTFAVAIGLGFSGFSLIELLGDQLKELVKAAFDTLKQSISRLTGKKDGD
ncbi:MAG: hypothetical protein IE933_03485 [Sphingomonadales bacterium]|nr:hypothetical protein [Sphingomonadales bacterium]